MFRPRDPNILFVESPALAPPEVMIDMEAQKKLKHRPALRLKHGSALVSELIYKPFKCRLIDRAATSLLDRRPKNETHQNINGWEVASLLNFLMWLLKDGTFGVKKEEVEVRIHESLEELSTVLADYIAELSKASVKDRGFFAIALSGGQDVYEGITLDPFLASTLPDVHHPAVLHGENMEVNKEVLLTEDDMEAAGEGRTRTRIMVYLRTVILKMTHLTVEARQQQQNQNPLQQNAAHPWIKEVDQKKIFGVMDCQKLTLEVCTRAAQNERLSLRAVLAVGTKGSKGLHPDSLFP
ncbi:BTB/POZ domain-containing protein [Tanacetum coccineum]|uniref:BTB/POZ domain-containing protein n=1 Tax=Tanacetum coccineum TaxID=301880 RepID=A0ABQ5BKS5_9ASTR